jgi:hypothetical protein
MHSMFSLQSGQIYFSDSNAVPILVIFWAPGCYIVCANKYCFWSKHVLSNIYRVLVSSNNPPKQATINAEDVRIMQGEEKSTTNAEDVRIMQEEEKSAKE